MTAPHDTEHFLPKEPLDLPREPLDLPTQPKDLPDGLGRQESSEHATTEASSPHEVRTLLAWKAPGRPFRKRSKDYYLTTLLLTLVIQVVLFLFAQYLLMLVVLSLVFVAFALATVPPHDFHYKVNTEGVRIEDHFYLWQELYDFYFKHRDGMDTVVLRTRAFFPGELTLSLGSLHQDQVKSVLLPYLPFREVVQPTFMDKSGDWLSKNFPLERKPHRS